jgi:outer membrane immunogenic protein
MQIILENTMMKIAVALSALAIGSIAASAADMAVKARPVVVEPATNWSGFYIGGEVGWADARQSADVVALPSPGFGAPAIPGAGLAGFGYLPTSYGLNRDNVIGGVYAGYNWQFGRSVLGIEGDINGLGNRSGSSTVVLTPTFPGASPNVTSSIQVSSRNTWLATLRGRLGYTWDKLMIYGTGGAAFTQTNYDINLNAGAAIPSNLGNNGVSSGVVSFRNDKVGFAVGAGAEWMVATNWIVRAEYMYHRFEGATGTFPILSPGFSCTAAANFRFQASASDLEIHTLRAGLSYKFGGPVVARY